MEKIGYIKKQDIYLIFCIIAIVCIIIFSITSSVSTSLTNSTSYISIFGFKIYELGPTVALIVGLLAFFGTLYNTDKNYKVMKLSSIPGNSANLLIDLEYAFNEFELCKLENRQDEFKLLTEILKYWKDHQKALKLLTPYFYKRFLKIMSTQININDKDNISDENSKYVIMAIKSQITNIAFEQNSNIFSFIKPELISDNISIKELGEDISNYCEFKINKNNFENYIHTIGSNGNIGKKTKEKTKEEFDKLREDITKLLTDLKREIDEYN